MNDQQSDDEISERDVAGQIISYFCCCTFHLEYNHPLIIIPASKKVLGRPMTSEPHTSLIMKGRNVLENGVYTLSCSDQYIHWYQGRERKLAWLLAFPKSSACASHGITRKRSESVGRSDSNRNDSIWYSVLMVIRTFQDRT